MNLPDEIKNRQFLVTDDYASMRMLIQADLQKLGITKIMTANSGNEAIKIINENMGKPTQIQFVLTDMMMKDGSGVDLTKAVRANPALKTLPILMISSMDDVGLIMDAVKAGINNYIVKPWELDDLAKKIIGAIKK